ncbi:MAG: deoxyguanosinetriphosphate triphosphohydrolase [Acidobacteriota bacterium]|nr:deoxyguanosinetriphosphate triphosphohydrolase [Acidobacteriota bacterium]
MRILTREALERREHELLSPEATHAASSLGRRRPEPPDPYRTCFQRDRDRIVHSKSFRRLANKTQVFLAPEGDHYRTRLTHTLEVAQVSCAIARSLALNVDLTEAVALGHDLGHTPFGHAGERALCAAMASHKGIDPASAEARRLFRHNEQSVRVVDVLEKNGEGLNLSFEVTDGMRCHSHGARAMTPEGRIVSMADRIAYVCHDIDDAERAGLLDEAELPAGARAILGDTSSERIATMVHDVVSSSSRRGDVCMSDDVWGALMSLRSYLYRNLYHQGDAKSEEPKAERVVSQLFAHFMAHLDEVPREYKLFDDPASVQVADFLASMTDRYAIRVFEELSVPRAWGLRSNR